MDFRTFLNYQLNIVNEKLLTMENLKDTAAYKNQDFKRIFVLQETLILAEKKSILDQLDYELKRLKKEQ